MLRPHPRRMRAAAPPPLLLLLLLLGALCRCSGAGCPEPLRGCKCAGERAKGPAVPSPARKRVGCGGQGFAEPPSPRWLPNGTVTLLLYNNKITTLENASFFGLRTLEKLSCSQNHLCCHHGAPPIALHLLYTTDLKSLFFLSTLSDAAEPARKVEENPESVPGGRTESLYSYYSKLVVLF